MKQSIHELRGIAQAKGIKFSFADDALALAQKINEVNEAVIPKELPVPERPAYDARLMNKPPSKQCDKAELINRLQSFADIGLRLSFPDEETWQIEYDKKADSGTMRMPVVTVLRAAERLMR